MPVEEPPGLLDEDGGAAPSGWTRGRGASRRPTPCSTSARSFRQRVFRQDGSGVRREGGDPAGRGRVGPARADREGGAGRGAHRLLAETARRSRTRRCRGRSSIASTPACRPGFDAKRLRRMAQRNLFGYVRSRSRMTRPAERLVFSAPDDARAAVVPDAVHRPAVSVSRSALRRDRRAGPRDAADGLAGARAAAFGAPEGPQTLDGIAADAIKYVARWAASSAGRAPRSQRGGRGFEPLAVHQPPSP